MKRRSAAPVHSASAVPLDAPPCYEEDLSLQELDALVRCVKTLTALWPEWHRGVDADRETMRCTIAELRDVLRRIYYPDASAAVYDAEGYLILPDTALLTPNRRFYAPPVFKLDRALEKMMRLCRLNRPSDGGPTTADAPALLPETGKTGFCRNYAAVSLFCPFLIASAEN